MNRIESLTPAQIESELERLDRLDRRDDLACCVLAGLFFLVATALYAGVAAFAFQGAGAATTGCAVFGALAGGAGTWLVRKVRRRRRIRRVRRRQRA
ncbi:hypothetical protein BFF78_31735 [Streptomyces fodineus]|uniref:Uncharacterized protein n=1 Tax=Streptomyces fodineus TaxID=1904616 RepID=A0A1D7YHK5_9ACTN|nr:hypothetical protein [Streptomyces fodineus]AOR35016.1 hypothetical protein BFF78_31735 [Streptomyces fodineus]